ncbi:MAG: single-stranded-DNA-specific exonuclease RecJ [Cyanobacteriota bacterium]|nr:single-stranded-DNA-specific exonuclease RecJ [Cyanobacteriota bacterium]
MFAAIVGRGNLNQGSHHMASLPPQRWQQYPPQVEQAAEIARQTYLYPLVAQVLLNRGLRDSEEIAHFLGSTPTQLPDPTRDFVDLSFCVDLLQQALADQQKMAICGDYDADGMTSTALLLRTLRFWGGAADYQIPSRMTEGYGLNQRMVEDLAASGVGLIITVDNGIAAVAAIERAKQLGLTVIVTDHHDLPTMLPPADAILNPKLIADPSPYQGMAGVGVAYLLALHLCERMGDPITLQRPLLELFTLGTIADLAPLTGVNRLWVKQGLQLLPSSQIPGIQALLRVTGLDQQRDLQPEAIGFGLGPRINAVGRLAQPQVVIDLLTTDDPVHAQTLAQECEALNQERQRLCREIEEAAIEQIEASGWDPQTERVLTVLGTDWHHGVIGIVASRLVERYGAPVFIGSTAKGEIRGSARGIPEFHVFQALESCQHLFLKHGGHTAAGGFSMMAEQWPALEEALRHYAQTCLEADHIQPLVVIDAETDLNAMTMDLYQQIQQLQPCGIGNQEPVFSSRHLQVIRQSTFGREGSHLRVQVRDPQGGRPFSGIAWKYGMAYPLPRSVHLAYSLTLHHWQGETELQLQIKGIQASSSDLPRLPVSPPMPTPTSSPANALTPHPTIVYRPAPPIPHRLHWHPLDRLSILLPTCQGTALLYGYRRPQVPQTPSPQGDPDQGLTLHYDRPQGGYHYDHLFLWSWPPSITHLAWLLASTPPTGEQLRVYVHQQVVPLLPPEGIRRQLHHHLQSHDQVDLLRLAQQWWLAPSTLVAGLRALHYPCETFPPTGSLAEELEKLQRWYGSSYETVAAMLERDDAAISP